MPTKPKVKTLPAPTWSGFAPDMVPKFTEFTVTRAHERANTEPALRKRELEDATNRLQYATDDKKSLDQDLKVQRAEAKKISDKIAKRGLKSSPEQEMAKILAMPFVLGTRLDPNGRLVIQIRLATAHDVKRDIADVEVVFDAEQQRPYYRNDNEHFGYVVNVIRPSHDNDFEYYFQGYTHNDSDLDVLLGKVYLKDDRKDYIAEGDFSGLVQKIHDYLVEMNTQEIEPPDPDDDDPDDDNFPVLTTQPESVWDGFVSNPVKALERAIQLHPTSMEKSLREVTDQITRIERSLEASKNLIRERNNTVRLARAAYEKARAQVVDGITIDLVEIMDTLAKISQLPGVMGMKFNEFGVPILHIRSSYEFNGKRYDVGDYEVTFSKHHDRRAVVPTWATRDGANDQSYHRYRNPRDAWFCYGSRADELIKMFDGDDYVAFTSLLINTLNGLNENMKSHESITYYHNEIPFGLVWGAVPAKTTARKKIEQAMGRTAVQA